MILVHMLTRIFGIALVMLIRLSILQESFLGRRNVFCKNQITTSFIKMRNILPDF